MRLSPSGIAVVCFATFTSSTAFNWAALAKDLERRQTFFGTGISPTESPTSVPTSSINSSTPTSQVRTSSTPGDYPSSVSSDTSTETFPQTPTTSPLPTSSIASTPSSATSETGATLSSTPETTSSTTSSSSVEPSVTSEVSSSISSSLVPSSFISSPPVSTGPVGVVTSVLTVDGSGTRITSVYTSATPVSETNDHSTVTPEASLNSGHNEGSSGSGLSDSSKKVIGGVVGGVGGAIVLGALAFVAWRLWGKKHGQPADDDYHYSTATPGHAPSASVGTENTVGTTGTTGLEKYDQPHRPAVSPNATTATNF